MASTEDRVVPRNPSTRVYVLVMGVLIGSSGVAHGIFEIAQGNRGTGGMLLAGIGALTVIPNYLLTGIASVAMGTALIVWTFGFIHRRHGPVVFLILSLVLFVVGGGIAQAPAFVFVFAVATRINARLSWWERVLPRAARSFLSRAWLPTLLAGLSVFMVGVATWLVLLPPGEPRPIGPLHYAVWSFLLVGFTLLVLAPVFGFARDIEIAASRNAAQQAHRADNTPRAR